MWYLTIYKIAKAADHTLFLLFQRVSVMGLVWLTVSAVQVDSAFAFPTMGDRSVMNVHQATMDTLTVLVGLIPLCPLV